MEAIAGQLVAFIRARVSLPARATDHRVESLELRQFGDIAVMLDLPAGQTLYPPETVTIRSVLAPDGTPWQPSRDADVLVLGDSFSNIYSLASMGWGDSRGVRRAGELLLQRPVDRIVQNDQGCVRDARAAATRAATIASPANASSSTSSRARADVR